MKRLNAVILSLLVLNASPWAQEGKDTRDIPDDVVRKVDPAVVAIQHERAVGSGFVVSKDGYILTNGHVVRGNDREDPMEPAKHITVIMHDERKFPAEVVGFCMDPDVALIKVEADTPFIPVEFADSKQAQIGQKCFAVGTPVGLKRTFTSGILSNVDRTDLGTFTRVLQTDAAINPGNSGGPLFDHHGRVLGINTYASRGQNNLGFTIPIHVATVLQKHFLTHGRFVRSDVPIFFAAELYDELATALQIDKGILVHYVMPDTPADAAGLKPGDIMVSLDGKPCSARTRAEMMDFAWGLTIRDPGTAIAITVLRGPLGKRSPLTLKATLEAEEPQLQTQRFPGELITHRYQSLGLDFTRLVRMHRVYLGLQNDPGVLVHRASMETPAGKAGLRKGDIITHVDGQATPHVKSFQQTLERRLSKTVKAIELTIKRRKTTIHTALAPYYALKGKKVVLVVPPGEAEYLDLLLRELVADGAELTVATTVANGFKAEIPKEVTLTELTKLKQPAFDVVLFADSPDADALWTNPHALKLVKSTHANSGVLAAIGAASLTLVAGETSLLDKKITTRKDMSGEAMKRKANYTGNDVESDGNVVTTTGLDRQTIREFVKTLQRLALNNG